MMGEGGFFLTLSQCRGFAILISQKAAVNAKNNAGTTPLGIIQSNTANASEKQAILSANGGKE
jgi:hypothetical protein